MSDAPVIIMGRIFSVQGQTPGPASGITYTIGVYGPTGGIIEIANQSPGIERWADRWDVRAVKPGTAVMGWIEAGRFYFWNFRELPDPAPCPGSSLGVGPPPPMDNFGNPLPITPPSGGEGGASVTGSTGADTGAQP